MRVSTLRTYGTNPDISDVVIHFSGRIGTANDYVPESIQKLDDRRRLLFIVLQRQINAFPQFGVGNAAVCFSESTQNGIQRLVKERRYSPWGIAFRKPYVFSEGGGPAFYVRGDEWESVTTSLPADLRFRCVRLWPGAKADDGEVLERHIRTRSEWHHEREWRLSPEDGDSWRFDIAEVAFLLVESDSFLSAQSRFLSRWKEVPRVQMTKTGEIIEDTHGIWR